MKILHLTSAFYPKVGGIESFTAALLPALQARGYQNLVFTSHSAQPLPDSDSLAGIPIQRVPYLTALTSRDPAGILRSKLVTARVKREFAPDLIHLHLGGPLAALHLMTAAVAPAPLVVTVYDFTPPGQDSASLQAVLREARGIAAISSIRLDECLAAAPESANRMQLIPVSLPARPFDQPVELSPVPLVLMAGRQVPEKGFDLALEAFQSVRAALPAARLMLVGDGPVHAQLAARIRELGLDSSVQLTGRLPAQDLARLYRQAWVTLVPSTHSESFGLVALEAMQAACPVVASRTGGLADVVVDGQTGLLVPPGDAQSLAAAVLRLLADPAWARQLGQAGRVRAGTTFAWQTCLDQYDAFYQKVLAL